MKTKFDHSVFSKLVAEVKVAKICDDVASKFEAVNNISDEVLLHNVEFANGEICAKFFVFSPNALKEIIIILNPLQIVKYNDKILPKMIADKLGITYELLDQAVIRSAGDSFECHSLICENDTPKYFIHNTIQFIR